MKTKNIIDCERERLNKIINFRLPTYYKTIGILLLILSFITLMSKIFIPNQPEIIREFSKKGILVGMLIISISKDKQEDEMTKSLRAQSYAIAFVIGVFYALIMPYVDYGVSSVINSGGESLKDLGDFQVLIFMLMIQLMFYHTLKRYR